MNTVKKEVVKGFTQFEITSDLLRNLYKFNLTPVTKLVLLELTTHLNESKNGSVVFPSVGYIAEVLGIGLTACKKAINDLINEGLIIKSKRDNVKGNYNKYLLRLAKIDFNKGKNGNRCIYTKTDLNSQKMQNKPSENELFKQSDSDLFFIKTNNNEKINNKDDEYLKLYALKRGVKNIPAYINAIKKNGGAAQIINEFKQIKNRKKVLEQQTVLMREKRIQEREQAVPPTEAWKALRNTIFKDYK